MVTILNIIGPIYLAIALGFISVRCGVFQKADMRVLGKFTTQFALPALLFITLSKRNLSDLLHFDYLAAFALSSVLMVGMGVWWARQILRQTISFGSMMGMGMSCPNSVFIGYPILLLVLGPVAGVALTLNLLIENLLLIPLLLAVADSERNTKSHWRMTLQQSLGGLIRNPIIWGILSGFIFSVFKLDAPVVFTQLIGLFSQASAALSLFVIGGTLVGLKVQGLWHTVLPIALGKLILHPVIMTLVLLYLFPVSNPSLRTAAMLSAALPMFGMFTILSQRHGHDTLSAAAMLVTTVLSFFTLSGYLWYLT